MLQALVYALLDVESSLAGDQCADSLGKAQQVPGGTRP